MTQAPRFQVTTTAGTRFNPNWLGPADARRAAQQAANEEGRDASAMQELPSGEWVVLATYQPEA